VITLKLRLAATISTLLVMVVGLAMISPLFFPHGEVKAKQIVMITFSVQESDDVVEWTKDLSSILNDYKMPATVFVVGKLAEQHPEVVFYYGNDVDVGSQTYDNTNLTSIPDYSLKLEEVAKGKAAVDMAGHISSSIFRAPYGATDQDIYSLLSRSGIVADFSYKDQYNVYKNGQFVKFDAIVFDGHDHPPDFFIGQDVTSEPLIINFDNTYSTSEVESFLVRLKTGDFEFVNASELVGINLTSRGA
jgi:peptidoglycan/xylan/chitin deacetylase (PgdA/CDA1 family)